MKIKRDLYPSQIKLLHLRRVDLRGRQAVGNSYSIPTSNKAVGYAKMRAINVTTWFAMGISSMITLRQAIKSRHVRMLMLNFALFVLILPASVRADVTSCGHEIRQLCGDSENITSCVADNWKKLPEPCQQQLNSGQAACTFDSFRFCTGVLPGGGRILNCLMDHQDDLSRGCRTVIKRVSQQLGR